MVLYKATSEVLFVDFMHLVNNKVQFILSHNTIIQKLSKYPHVGKSRLRTAVELIGAIRTVICTVTTISLFNARSIITSELISCALSRCRPCWSRLTSHTDNTALSTSVCRVSYVSSQQCCGNVAAEYRRLQHTADINQYLLPAECLCCYQQTERQTDERTPDHYIQYTHYSTYYEGSVNKFIKFTYTTSTTTTTILRHIWSGQHALTGTSG